jgi:hypothetical protein
MRNLLAILAVLVIVAVSTGWYRGWYALEPLEAAPGKTAFRVEIDRVKVGGDFVAGAKAVQRFLSSDRKESEASE